MLSFDLLIPTAGNMHPLESLLSWLIHQSVLPQHIVLLVRKKIDKESLQTFLYAVHKLLSDLSVEVDIVSHLTSDHLPEQGVGYDRNFLLQQTKETYLCMLDEDNELSPDFFAQLVQGYTEVTDKLGCPCIVSPTIMYGRSGHIQSQGITDFSFLLPRYTFGRCGDRPWQQVKMIGANSLFGRTELFQRLGFDSRMVGSYEDIDFSYRATLAGTPVVVLRDVSIYHMERKRSYLAQRFLWTPESAYFRSRNRILFVRKNADLRQKIEYFTLGLRLQTFRFLLLVLRYGEGQRWQLIRAILKGIRDSI